MISCPICHAENHHLAVTCPTCRSFLQTRVENLDLFATLWGIIEHPGRTFHRIGISHHKNYSLILPALGGVAFSFTYFWLFKVGERTDLFSNILAAGIAISFPVGLAVALFVASMMTALSAVYGLHARFRNVLAITGYAMMPVLVISFLIVPLELMTFGRYFFTTNPSPMLLKPLSYVVLLFLHMLLLAWSALLLVIGMKALLGTSWGKPVIIVGCAVLALVVLSWGGIHLMMRS